MYIYDFSIFSEAYVIIKNVKIYYIHFYVFYLFGKN